jgi:hypothetical protein
MNQTQSYHNGVDGTWGSFKAAKYIGWEKRRRNTSTGNILLCFRRKWTFQLLMIAYMEPFGDRVKGATR